jgi:hypothetical protein
MRAMPDPLLLVHGMAFPGQQQMEAAITEARPLPRCRCRENSRSAPESRNRREQ